MAVNSSSDEVILIEEALKVSIRREISRQPVSVD